MKIITSAIAVALFLTSLLPSNAQTKKLVVKKTAAVVASPAVLLKASVVRGNTVYASTCLPCHQPDGGGVPNLNAPLIKTSFVLGDKFKLIGIILKGMQGVEIDGEMYSNVMPSFAHLTDKQIADVLTYVRNSFGNKASAVMPADVLKMRK